MTNQTTAVDEEVFRFGISYTCISFSHQHSIQHGAQVSSLISVPDSQLTDICMM